MFRFIIRRLLQAVLVFLGATALLFTALNVLGNPVTSAAGSDKARNPEVIKTLTAEYHLNDPLIEQYGRYVVNVVQGNLGQDLRTRRDVTAIIEQKAPRTIRLALLAILFDMIIGLVTGVISAVYKYSVYDILVTIVTTFLIGFPAFVIGIVLQNIFAIQARGSFVALPIFGANGFESYLMPAFTLAIIDAALVARLMRGSMLEVLRADYIRTATAKGLSRRVVILKHALRNSIIPVITYLGISFGSLLGGAVITENIFQFGGLGSALGQAITQNNNPVINGIVVEGVLVFVLINLLVDIGYAFLDPRIRLE